MGARWTRVTLEDRRNDLRQAVATLPSFKKDMERLAEQGAQIMQEYIASRGTAYSAERAGRGRGGSGRRDSYEMFDAVDYRAVSQAAGVVNAEFGWIDNFQKYFGYQEKGTRTVEAMFALRDASTIIREQFAQMGDQMIAELAKKIGR